MDAFSHPSLKTEDDTLHESSLKEKLHQFMNTSVLLVIIVGVSIHRHNQIDLPSMFVTDKHLRPAFETLI